MKGHDFQYFTSQLIPSTIWQFRFLVNLGYRISFIPTFSRAIFPFLSLFFILNLSFYLLSSLLIIIKNLYFYTYLCIHLFLIPLFFLALFSFYHTHFVLLFILLFIVIFLILFSFSIFLSLSWIFAC